MAGFNSKLPEDEWAFIKKYNEYTEKYTYVPENLTRIRNWEISWKRSMKEIIRIL